MKIKEILKKKIFWKFNLFALIAYTVLFGVLLLALNIYTHHGHSKPIPDFKGLSIDRVKEIAAYEEFRIEIADSTFVAYLPKGSVIDQYPQAGINVKKNRTIFVTINAFNQVKVEVPKVVGFSYRQGKAIIERKGLTVGKLIYKPDFARNNILKQMYKGKAIDAGAFIEKGEAIDLVLGNGNEQAYTAAPNVVGQKLQLAKRNINEAYLNLGKVRFDSTVHDLYDSLNAFIYRQWPKHNYERQPKMGGRIDLWLSLDSLLLPKPDTTLVNPALEEQKN